MKINSVSYFKNLPAAMDFFNNWIMRVAELSGTSYERINLETALGETVVWGINRDRVDLKTIVIFPGFRTCSLFWDLDNGLKPLKGEFRIFLVDTNGQPNLSDGNTPDIKSNDYGAWAADVLKKLRVGKAIVAGASFGALVGLKLCIVAPRMVEKVILLNPGCLQTFSLSLRNLYYNLLPLISPTTNSVEKFLDNAVFHKDKHSVSPAAKKLVTEYELFAIKQYVDKTQKPYAMKATELEDVISDVYLVVSDKDPLFPYQKSVKAARKYIRTLRGIFILADIGHGIETSHKAMEIVAAIASGKEESPPLNERTYKSEPVNVIQVSSD